MFISMETLGFATFFLIAFDKGYKSKEATFKYLIMSAVASAIFLFGVSYLYGISGSINFSENLSALFNPNSNFIIPDGGDFYHLRDLFQTRRNPFC